MPDAPHDPRFCDCCEGPVALTPAEILNRPGLSEIAYRIGVFASFRQAMLEAIGRDPRLVALTTRAPDDMAISVLEAFAAVGDVLTFYNERLANELYLRTARDRDSVQRLVRLIGYRLRPGLAAATDLVFDLDPGAALTLRRGLKTMSVPLAEEMPVFFETLEDLEADAALNRPFLFGVPTPFNGFARGRREAPVTAAPESLKPADRMVFWGAEQLEVKRVGPLRPTSAGRRIAFEPPVQFDGWDPHNARAARLLDGARFFGHDAPEKYPHYDLEDQTLPPAKRWQLIENNFMITHDVPSLPLDRSYDDLDVGDALLVDAGANALPRLRTVVITAVEDGSETFGNITDTVTRIDVRETLRGTPAIGEGPFVFARSGAGWLVHMDREAGEVSWSYPPLQAASDPAVVGRIACFRGSDGRLFQVRVGDNFNVPAVFPGNEIVGTPAIASPAPDEIHAFARGVASDLVTLRTNPVPAGPWISLGGIVTSDPWAVMTSSGLQVFVRGIDRGLWRRARSGGAWLDWEPLRGVLATGPAAAVTGPGRVDVVALDDEGRLIHRREVGPEWSNWTVRGGELIGRPVPVAGPGRLDIFATGVDGQLWLLSRVGDAWEPWRALGGELASPPAAHRGAGRLDVVARGRDGTLMERSWTAGGWSEWRALGDGMLGIPDRRRARIYKIDPTDIVFREYDYPPRAEGGDVAIRVGPDADLVRLARLLKDRRVLIQGEGPAHQTTVSVALPHATRLGDRADHLRLSLEQPMPATADAVLFGNVAPASHGETQPPEVLGGGDAAKALQVVHLGRAPLTYLPDAMEIGGKAELDLRVDGVRWRPVESLYGRGPDERVFVLRETDAGETEATFGDGRFGARLTRGVGNVEAIYRTGLGLAGRVKAGQLSVLLEKPPGLSGVSNPQDAVGGADPETRDLARRSAPGQLQAFGRIVSLEDFVSVALNTGLVAKAHVTWVWQALERAAHLSVAGPGGAALSDADRALLHALLDAARLANRRLTIAGVVMIPIVVAARIVPAAGSSKDAALASARQAVEHLYAFEAVEIGRAAHVSALYAALHDAADVAAADVELFNVKGFADLPAAALALRSVTSAPVQPQIRAYAARPTPENPADIDPFAKAGFAGTGTPPPVLAAEQVHIESPAEDIFIAATEAL